ncbi:MAG: hypothetical protein E7598_03665 [Ruminococcaceae bacterium]|nr:hypothetical protein [Oscillospiraceae bacterium]
MKKGKSPFPMVGATSLIVIFAVLCITVFALLALKTAKSSSKLSIISAENAIAYYNADSEANEILARLRNGEKLQNVSANGNVYTYFCKISDTQLLNVEVEIRSQNDYTVLKWQKVYANDWQADDTMDIWDGIF